MQYQIIKISLILSLLALAVPSCVEQEGKRFDEMSKHINEQLKETEGASDDIMGLKELLEESRQKEDKQSGGTENEYEDD